MCRLGSGMALGSWASVGMVLLAIYYVYGHVGNVAFVAIVTAAPALALILSTLSRRLEGWSQRVLSFVAGVTALTGTAIVTLTGLILLDVIKPFQL